MRIEIVKAKITKHNTLEVEYLRHNDDETISEVSEKHDAIIHPDLQAAFQKLIPHMALLCDLRESDIIGKGKGKNHIESVPEDYFTKFEVRSFSIGGGSDSEGVTISGNKKLNSSQIFNINTPFQKYDDEQSEYPYGSELCAVVYQCVCEVEAYLNGKCAVKQQELQFHSNPAEEEVAA